MLVAGEPVPAQEPPRKPTLLESLGRPSDKLLRLILEGAAASSWINIPAIHNGPIYNLTHLADALATGNPCNFKRVCRGVISGWVTSNGDIRLGQAICECETAAEAAGLIKWRLKQAVTELEKADRPAEATPTAPPTEQEGP